MTTHNTDFILCKGMEDNVVTSVSSVNIYTAMSTVNENGKALHRGWGFDNSEAVQIDLSKGLYIEDAAARRRIATGIYSKSEFAMNYLFLHENYTNGLGYDIDAEFEAFMKERDCQNEQELEIIAKSNCYTMAEFKEKVGSCIQNDINVMQNLGFSNSDMSNLKDYVIENASAEELYSYINQSGFDNRIKILSEIIDNFAINTNMLFNKQDALDMIEKMLEYLKTNNMPDKPPLSGGELQYRLYLMSQYTKI